MAQLWLHAETLIARFGGMQKDLVRGSAAHPRFEPKHGSTVAPPSSKLAAAPSRGNNFMHRFRLLRQWASYYQHVPRNCCEIWRGIQASGSCILWQAEGGSTLECYNQVDVAGKSRTQSPGDDRPRISAHRFPASLGGVRSFGWFSSRDVPSAHVLN